MTALTNYLLVSSLPVNIFLNFVAMDFANNKVY